MPSVSPRGLTLPPSPIRKLAPYAVAARSRGIKVLHLNIGQPDLETPKVMRDRLQSVDPVIAYSPSAGTPEYLEALRGYYGPAFVQISTRGVESMSQRFDDINALSGTGGDPGDLTYDNLTIQPLGDGHAMAYGQLRLQFKDGSSIETWFSTVYEKTPFGWKAILAHQ